MWEKKYIDTLQAKKREAVLGGGEKRIEKQHSLGKLTARERLECLFDMNTFVEVGSLREAGYNQGSSKVRIPGDGVVTGYGMIHGKIVYASSQDFTVAGGTLGEAHALKICHIMDLAMEARAPYISINDSGGARIEEGICSLNGYSGMFFKNTKASGVIPQIAVILGPSAGGACYAPAICDFIFMSERTSQMFITGPKVVKVVTGEAVSADDLGGSAVHEKQSGVCHFVYEDDVSCLKGVRKLLEYLPQNNSEPPAAKKTKLVNKSQEIEAIVPDNMRRSYDVHDVIDTFVDEGSFFEIQKNYATNVIVGFSRLDGEVLAIVANQPKVMAGVLDVDASDKAARFVRFCDCFNIPILTLVDVPGYLPGVDQEHKGIIRHGAKLLYAFAEATVPKVSLIMRKAYGGAYIAMNSKNMGADFVYAWPIAELAVMGAEGAVDIINKKEISEAENPQELRKQRIEEYEDKYLNPYIAAANGYIDEIIEPQNTREALSSAYKALRHKKKETPWKKHGNIPL